MAITPARIGSTGAPPTAVATADTSVRNGRAVGHQGLDEAVVRRIDGVDRDEHVRDEQPEQDREAGQQGEATEQGGEEHRHGVLASHTLREACAGPPAAPQTREIPSPRVRPAPIADRCPPSCAPFRSARVATGSALTTSPRYDRPMPLLALLLIAVVIGGAVAWLSLAISRRQPGERRPRRSAPPSPSGRSCAGRPAPRTASGDRAGARRRARRSSSAAACCSPCSRSSCVRHRPRAPRSQRRGLGPATRLRVQRRRAERDHVRRANRRRSPCSPPWWPSRRRSGPATAGSFRSCSS